MNQRTCRACRSRQAADQMIPLGLTVRGSFVVGRDQSGRTAWTCKKSMCMAKVIAQPKKLFPTHNTAVLDPTELLSVFRSWLEERVRQQLVRAMRCGVIIMGSHRVKNYATENIVLLLFSSNVGSQTRSEILTTHNCIESLTIDISSVELGRLLRRGPRSVLALRYSRKTQSLIDTLRAWDSLG